MTRFPPPPEVAAEPCASLSASHGSASSLHREAHMIGKPITVIYEIKDPTAWRKTNPLDYEHNGVKAYCVSIGDVADRRDKLRQALEKIVNEGDFDAREIASAALDADASLSAERPTSDASRTEYQQ